MYESLKTKLTEMLRAKTPELDSEIENMEVAFLPPDGMKGMVSYKIGDKVCKSNFKVDDNEIEIDNTEADDTAMTQDSTAESPSDQEVVNNESIDLSSAMPSDEEITNEESQPEVDNAKTANVEAEEISPNPEPEATPEAEETEPKTETVVENSKISAEATFDELVEQYGYITALKIQDGTVNI